MSELERLADKVRGERGVNYVELREGVVTAQNLAGWTVTVQIDGNTSVDVAGVHVLGVNWPALGESVWVLKNGSDRLVLSPKPGRPGYYFAGQQTAAFNINTTFTSMTIPNEIEDPFLLHDTSANTERMVAPVAGTYLVSGWCFTGAQAAGGLNEGRVNVVGTGPSNGLDNGRYRLGMNTGSNNYFSITCPVLMDAGDYAVIQFLSSAGGVTTITPFFHASFTYLAPR